MHSERRKQALSCTPLWLTTSSPRNTFRPATKVRSRSELVGGICAGFAFRECSQF